MDKIIIQVIFIMFGALYIDASLYVLGGYNNEEE